MPKISFIKNLKAIEVPPGSNLMQALLNQQIPVASSCYGDGVCGRCKLTILSGSENISQANPTEDILRSRLKLQKDQRISCQVEVHGDITVDADYW